MSIFDRIAQGGGMNPAAAYVQGLQMRQGMEAQQQRMELQAQQGEAIQNRDQRDAELLDMQRLNNALAAQMASQQQAQQAQLRQFGGLLFDGDTTNDASALQQMAQIPGGVQYAQQVRELSEPSPFAQRQAAEAAAAEKAKQDRQLKDRTAESGVRKEFVSQSKEFTAVRDAYSRVQTAIAQPSAAGDLALVFNFMKMLDPGSVVREGEFATAQNAAGVDDRVRNIYNRLRSGERLTPEQRADFAGQARNLFSSQLEIHRDTERQYRGLAQRSNLNPENVVIDLTGGLGNDELDAMEQALTQRLQELRRGR